MRKRKALAVLLMLPVVGLLAGIGFYKLQPGQTETNLKSFLDRAGASKRVTVNFAVTVPADTPKDQKIYLSGTGPDLGNWDSAGVPLERGDDGNWHGAIDVRTGIDYAYKITRGTWGTVETDSKGAPISDRSLQVPNAQTVNVAVAEWVDHGQTVPGRITMVDGMRVIKNFRSKLLNNQRTLIVYLPPLYDQNTDERYPVLYMQDGQNLFDQSTSFAGVEWKMDEAAQKLIGGGEAAPFIIVGIYNTPDRNSEYTPPTVSTNGKATDGSPARGDLYAGFVVEELKPMIDQTFRTQADRTHTLIGGGSLGGLEAMYIAQTHPDVFGQIVALSPWLRVGDHKLVPGWIGDGKWLHQQRIYADMGTDPGNNGSNYPGGAAAAIADGKELAAALQSAGLQPDKDFHYQEIPGGKHDEQSWQAEIEGVLKWIFAKE